MRTKHLSISDEEFCTAYRDAPTIQALCLQLGAPPYAVRNKMAHLKKKHKIEWPKKPRPSRAPAVVDPQESEKLRALLSP